jgi:hypothetical protein
VKYADVTLLDNSEAVLGFADQPNPFRVYTTASIAPSTGDDPSTGWVQLDAVPTAYAGVLRDNFAGSSILVEIQLSGTTTSDVDVDFQPFLYPLAICKDCLSRCRSDPQFVADPSALTDLNSGKCTDNRAQDDRVCIDQGC